ncbi:TIGR03767 family metallophosphoesterase, partial [Streptomyces sp. B1866]|uniref:TIGR03767 family metallophosphoesterase n=1 Tax=Streptomyces sp. B1866 TaxID=3075431 RepID=UPI00289091A6
PAAARSAAGPHGSPHALATGAPAAGPARPSADGTTLRSVAAPRGSTGYRRLADGPGWARTVRTELAPAHAGRDARRTVLASFAQFTDLHLVDVQHPLRFEYLRAQAASAWRPQEALSVVGVVSLIERVNALRGGPVTGHPLSFVMTTGDNTDNNARVELDWFLTAMNGGRITPDTGDPRHYEGVQDSGLSLYWQPESALRDADKRAGFPRLDGFLAAATRPVHSPGLRVPWYSTVGNHDSLPGGAYTAGDPFFADFATGGRKLLRVSDADAETLWRVARRGDDPAGEAIKALLGSRTRQMRGVTPDERRAPFTPREYLAAHLAPEHTGPGPTGHGYTEDNLDGTRLYYTFPVADGVLGVSLDSTDPGGHFTGSVGTAQLRWLERTLTRHADERVLVFSHHTSTTMGNLTRDPARPHERRHGGAEVAALLARHRNVLAWINGHSHRNAIRPRDGFWEVTTASHVDYPQLARVIELVDNHDGTLSLFTTLVESAAPHRTDFADLSQTGLAALYRELAFNAPGARSALAGHPEDRNTELLIGRR